jgi:diketogulonate reductase-like aldo/keto reductase
MLKNIYSVEQIVARLRQIEMALLQGEQAVAAWCDAGGMAMQRFSCCVQFQ